MPQHPVTTRMRADRGFTLVELLVVITIIGLLGAVAVFSVAGVHDKGQTNACQIDTRTLRVAEEAYLAGPGQGLQYADMATLVRAGLLVEPSAYHDIQAADLVAFSIGPPAVLPRYTIRVGSADSRCGTAGAVVDGAGSM